MAQAEQHEHAMQAMKHQLESLHTELEQQQSLNDQQATLNHWELEWVSAAQVLCHTSS